MIIDRGVKNRILAQKAMSLKDRELEVFNRLSGHCVNCQHTDMGSCGINNFKRCGQRTCPLLKEIK